MNNSNSNISIEILTNGSQEETFVLKRRIRVTFRGVEVAVTSGFKSDGASVPRFFWRTVFPPMNRRALRAAIIHDYLYRVCSYGLSRKEADELFLYLMLWDGVRPDRAYKAYFGVRLFGKKSWRSI